MNNQNISIVWGSLVFKEIANSGNAVDVIPNSRQWSKVVGYIDDNSCTVTVGFKNTSPTLKFLYEEYKYDQETANGVYQMLITNKSAGKKQVINNAWIREEPQDVYSYTIVTFDGDNLKTIFDNNKDASLL